MRDQKKIGARLLLARDKLGISQAAFAKHFNVNQSTIHRWENNQIDIDYRTLFWIEHVLADLGFVYANHERSTVRLLTDADVMRDHKMMLKTKERP